MSTALVLSESQETFTDKQVAALVQLGVQDATPADLAVFFHQCQRTGLDPFARQIYMIGRRQKNRDGQWVTKQTIQTGIDGFRLIARRAADARGEVFSMDDVLWADPDGGWHDVWVWPTPPAAAKVTVHVGQGRFSAVAVTREYMPTKNGEATGQWRSMPAVMIAKCAEALALRKAFPMDLSGVYMGEEMAQADARTEHAPEQITYDQKASIAGLVKSLNLSLDQEQQTALWASQQRVADPLSMTATEAQRMIDFLVSKLPAQLEAADDAEPQATTVEGAGE